MLPEQQQRIMQYFIEEAKDHLNTIEQGLLNLQSTIEDSEQVNEVFRAAHSVKGGAGMLGISSIEETSHRLEDCFKLLKECPVEVDQKLESLFLRVFDALKELVEQLSATPDGLAEEVAEAIMSGVEPVFIELTAHLGGLVSHSGLIVPGAAKSAPAAAKVAAKVPAVAPKETKAGKQKSGELQEESALQLIFQSDVPAYLREMLQLFKQPDGQQSRQKLQDICRSLVRAGEQFDLRNWSELLECASKAISNPNITYSTLAPLVIKEIKQAQELVLAGLGAEIAVSSKLKALQPAQKAQPAPAERAVAGAGSRSSSHVASGTGMSGSNKSQAGKAKSPSTAHGGAIVPGEEGEDFTRQSSIVNRYTPANEAPVGKRAGHTGPEVGMAELNSLADLFEGESPELDSNWEPEEVNEPSAREKTDNFVREASANISSDLLASDFSDLLFEEDGKNEPAEEVNTVDELNSLFGDALLDDDSWGAAAGEGENLFDNSSEELVEEGLTFDFNSFDDAPQTGAAEHAHGSLLDATGDFESLNLEGNDSDLSAFSETNNLEELFAGLNEKDPMFADSPSQSKTSGSAESNLEALFEDSEALDFSPQPPSLSIQPTASASQTQAAQEWNELWDTGEAASPDTAEPSWDHNGSGDNLEFESLFEEEDAPKAAPAPANAAATQDDLSDLLAITEPQDVQTTSAAEEISLDVFSDTTTDNLGEWEHLDLDGLHPSPQGSKDRNSENLDALFGDSDLEPNPEAELDWDAETNLEDLLGLETVADTNWFDTETDTEEVPAIPAIRQTANEVSFAQPAEETLNFDGDLADLFELADEEPQETLGTAGSDNSLDFGEMDLFGGEPDASTPETGLDSSFAEEWDLFEGADLDLDLLSTEAEETLSMSGDLNALFGSEPASETELPDFSSNWLNSEVASEEEPLTFEDLTVAAAADDSENLFDGLEDSSDEIDNFDFDDSLLDTTEAENFEQSLEQVEPVIQAASLTLDTGGAFDDLEALLEEKPTAFMVEGAPSAVFSELENFLNPPAAPAPVQKPVAAPPQLEPMAKPAQQESEFADLEELLSLSEMTMPGGRAAAKASPGPISPKMRPKAFAEQTMRVPIKQLDNLSNLVGELVVNRNSLEQDQERLRQFLDNLLHQVQQLSDVGQRMQDLYERSLLEISLLSSRQHYQSSRNNPARDVHLSGASFDALEMDRFTGFHTQSQEIIELIVRVRESAADIEFLVDETEQVTRQLRQVTTQLQEGLTRSRMVPFSSLERVFPLARAVRDKAIEHGKQAEIRLEGRDTMLDKLILEHLSDPLKHLINNAIAHGIEMPEVRQRLGKPAVGRITIRAFHQGNQTVISFSDDGAGIDTERVKMKAAEKGLIKQSDVQTMSRLDVYELLYHPGFSTMDQANMTAGRGVGMDVIRNDLSEIRGVITTDSTPGKGTTFTIRLPLTLSISKALCCISDRARIAFPMDGVEDMLDVPRDRVQTAADGQTCIPWRDSMLPFRHLRELLAYNRHLGRGSVYGSNAEDDVISVVVLRSAGNYLALQVDQVLGEQEIVIKQLEGPVPKPIGVAGATVMGDGRIVAIADVLELIDLAAGRLRKESGGALWDEATHTPAELPPEKTEPTVLIVDDSITVRELLSMTFNKAGYRVEQARDGQEAWEKLRSGLPCDIVFCDIEMPRMDGLELLSRMQKDPILTDLPIAMLTSRGADRHRQMAVQLGARGYFTKPYLEEALLEAANRMLKGEVLVITKAEA
ncbi:response regulator [Microcoleus sp. FACHB-68]|uniref:response regulator n=1 Tax=Microcoleus sp. FACHB-68 TaxID=2692826 RepID=UPI0016879A35|nr:response regulator [Microcoleus sp. FACHB-68]MBD1937485.1 response regulator [Microcoleus sp. FACHB-68]